MSGVAYRLVEAGQAASLALHLNGLNDCEAAKHKGTCMDKLAEIADHLGLALVDKTVLEEGERTEKPNQ